MTPGSVCLCNMVAGVASNLETHMLAAVCFGTNDLNRAGQFYDKVFSTLGIDRLVADENEPASIIRLPGAPVPTPKEPTELSAD